MLLNYNSVKDGLNIYNKRKIGSKIRKFQKNAKKV